MKSPRILVAAASSGSGKTTAVCGLLQALVDRGLKVSSFKCGPDYIDPMFHSKAIGTKSRNLDSFFVDTDMLKYLFGRSAEGSDISVIEGVMGFYDGMSLDSHKGSSYDISEKLECPAVLIVDCKGAALSCIATVKGFKEFRGNRIAGAIMNRMSERTYSVLKPILERETGIKALGFIPDTKDMSIESRHLGLVMPDEMDDIKAKLSGLASLMEKTVDIDGIINLAHSAPDLDFKDFECESHPSKVRIGVASDEAFCFEYADNIELFERCGAEIVRFSPIHDRHLPEGIGGVIFYGGYPELKAEELSSNGSMISDVREKLRSGMPCLAECGGFMYLGRELEDAEGRRWPMVGAIDSSFSDAGKLSRFGYAEFTALSDNAILEEGGTVKGHEFHYWDGDGCGGSFEAEKTSGMRYRCIHASETMIAGFPHLYYYSNPGIPFNFLTVSKSYLDKQNCQ